MKNNKFLIFLLLTSIIFSCQKEILVRTASDSSTSEVTELTFEDTEFTATDWGTNTHSKEADPNFTEVFDDNQVKRIDITITPNRWKIMQENMTSLYGTFGSSASGGPGGPGSSHGGLSETEDPIFVPAEVFYNGKEWYRVGIRFKGNSSIQSTWASGNLKLSLKLDFDEFEDIYPQIENQRFYGFKKFSLKNNYEDKSFLREKVCADIFKNAGLAVSHTAFYTLYVDYGEGPQYFGLYTLVEEVDNTVIKTQFKNNNGNLYKPENDGSTFVKGTFSQEDFEKKTNEEEADWSDITKLFSVLHDDSRTTSPEEWRSDLEKVFDTDIFLKYLATNTIIQNWDTYGRMPHNYYLYNNPANSKLTWLTWDNNEALQSGKMGGSLALDFSDLSQGDWPLIEYLYADDVYRAKYNQFVQEVIEGTFEANYIKQVYSDYTTLIEPYATSELSGFTFLNSNSDFQQAISDLNSHADSRAVAVSNYFN